ncbi:MBL fold metallo-hydrolase [Puniceicoccaceae bacterium K14]|nr:MBL fold metallo-hydrolase [Puniceicoccaceae bacterium K14]
MRITDLNREGGIGSNSLFIEIGNFKIVVDAGLHPKFVGLDAAPQFDAIKDEQIDCVIITHCHLDHIGSVPLILRDHPEARVFMSLASDFLLERMLHNSCNVMKRQKAEQSIPEYPLFEHEELEELAKRFEPLRYKKTHTLVKDGQRLEFILHAAGHVVGACGIEIKCDGKTVFHSGDVLFNNQRILPGADFPDKEFDTVILETTKGATESNPADHREVEVDRLLAGIRNTLERGGSVLIPVFALGRMQEIITILNDARKEGLIPRCPVFGAGLGLALSDYFDQIAKRTGAISFTRKSIKELKMRRPPKKLVPGKELSAQGIYILSSGMLVEHTPSYMLASTLLHRGRNSIFFVGYCDPDTPGGKLLASETGDEFIFEAIDYQTNIRAQVDHFQLSGHADREELLAFALRANPKNIVLTHGDQNARDWFSQSIKSADPTIQVIDPTPLEPYTI